MKKTFIALVIAFVLWFLMFSPWMATWMAKNASDFIIPFWYKMLISAAILFALSVNRVKWQVPSVNDVFLGIGSAVVLWGLFWLGHYFFTKWFNSAEWYIRSIYKLQADGGFKMLHLSLIIGLCIAPVEEIFWRGFIQHQWSNSLGKTFGCILVSMLYAAVHIPSWNFILVMAALVCGLFWGLMYRYTYRIWPVIISHALWDCAIFTWFPIY